MLIFLLLHQTYLFIIRISDFFLSYSFRKLFIKTNSSLLITESIKVLEIKTSMLFNLDFSNNTI